MHSAVSVVLGDPLQQVLEEAVWVLHREQVRRTRQVDPAHPWDLRLDAVQGAASTGDRSVRRLPPGGASDSDRIKPGQVSATSGATPAPNEDPTTWQESTPRYSRVALDISNRIHRSRGSTVGLAESV